VDQQAGTGAATSTPTTFLRRHQRLLIGGAVLVAVYLVAAATVLPSWLVSMSASTADADTKLAAITATRTALLDAITPIVVLFGGIAALLNYQETAEQNRRANERAEKERDEERRLRRAEVYVDFVRACERQGSIAADLYYTAANHPRIVERRDAVVQASGAVAFAHDRVRLLGADEVQAAASNLHKHCGEIGTVALAFPKASKEEWTRVWVTDYALHYKTFLDASRADLALTR